MKLRLPITAVGGKKLSDLSGGLWTQDVSAGGVYFHFQCGLTPRKGRPAGTPEVGEALSFELLVPPGEGYSVEGGTVKCAGRIVRADRLDGGALGIAVQYTQPLGLEF